MCDVESYIYMPMLEEMGYVPTTRYASGEEIRRHLDAIAERYDLVDDALFHTDRAGSRVGRGGGALACTPTGATRSPVAHYLLVASGILNLMKLPGDPRHGEVRGALLPHGAMGLRVHGRRPGRSALDELGDKVVGIVGTGASGDPGGPAAGGGRRSTCTCSSARRRRSGCGATGRRRPDFAERPRARVAAARMENFQAVMLGGRSSDDLTDDGWTHHYGAAQRNPKISEGPCPRGASSAEVEEFDYRDHGGAPRPGRRDRRTTRATAESLKPYYRYICKRPCFHDEYLAAFNRPTSPWSTARRVWIGSPSRVSVVDGEEIRARLHRLRHRFRGRAHAGVPRGPATTSSVVAA